MEADRHNRQPPTMIVIVARVGDLPRIRPLQDDIFTLPTIDAVCADQDAAELPWSEFNRNEQDIWVGQQGLVTAERHYSDHAGANGGTL
ncbi:hypothetical protein ON010_g9980 [Phytophthora cinnamomi]|nr:hypothetical protein ON010_g9980 [Phytophthora cinnamomi]